MLSVKATKSRQWLPWLGRQLTNSTHPGAYLDPLLTRLNPMWGRGHTPGRIEGIVEETPDSRSFLVRPSRRWSGFSPGQHLTVGLDIDGKTFSRTFSLACSPSLWSQQGLIRVIVKRARRGKVTGWMLDHLRTGDVLTLSGAFGDFQLPEEPRPLLYLAGGSGITPVLSHLEYLSEAAYAEPVTLIYYARTAADAIAWSRIESLEQAWPALTARLICTREPDTGTPNRICAGHLSVWARNIRDRHCFLCGPEGLMEASANLLQSLGAAPEAISRASFFVPRPLAQGGQPGILSCLRSGRRVHTRPGQSLLEAAEGAGLAPKHGCRMGICHQCSCRKISGQVRNRLNGTLSGSGEETIQICISEAQGPVELSL